MRIFNRRGFTLIELIIVLIIIGILATVAAPMMSGMKMKAICTEAVTGLGTIRTALRQYYMEYGRYPDINSTPGGLFLAGQSYKLPGLTLTDGSTNVGSSLDGTYISQNCYFIFNLSNKPFLTRIECWLAGNYSPTENIAVRNAEISTAAATLDPVGYPLVSIRLDNGKITSNMPSSGYPSS